MTVNRSISYEYVKNAIRKGCGFPSARNKLVQYFSDKNSFDISKDDFNSHYWNMRDIRISCLLKKESDITFEGAAINCDHDENFCRRAQ
jgi:hypothetical protein